MKPETCTQCVDKYTWLAKYADGGYLEECTESNHRVYADLDLANVVCISWGPNGVSMEKPGVSYIPVLFRRRMRGVNLVDEEIVSLPTIHGLGWEYTQNNGSTSGTYMFLFDDGSVLTSTDRNAV